MFFYEMEILSMLSVQNIEVIIERYVRRSCEFRESPHKLYLKPRLTAVILQVVA